jgi:hypothetical protein
MRLLPGGLFSMGSQDFPNESPPRKVFVPYPLAVGAYEVSVGEFTAFCKSTGTECPEQPRSEAHYPAVNISRSLAKAYAKWLNRQTGRGYRLPTEAEWEYAARAGTPTPYPVAESDLGVYAHFSRLRPETAPIPKIPQRTNPNPFGLFHMAGNVREWVLDSWHENYSGAPADARPYLSPSEADGVVRGGSFADKADGVRSSARFRADPEIGDEHNGIRLVRDVYIKPGLEDPTLWGGWWLAFQPDEYFSIQLYALRQLEEVKRLLSEHQELPLRVIPSNLPDFTYRVLYGLFDSEASARQAMEKLPDVLAGTQGRIKRIGDIRPQQ